MYKIKLNQNLRAKITDDEIKDVVLKSVNSNDFTIEIAKLEAEYIIIEGDTIRNYVILSGIGDGNNIIALQPFASVYYDYYYDTSIEKTLSFYIRKTDANKNRIRTDYQIKFAYRILKTMGVNFLNFNIINLDSIQPFINYNDMKNTRANLTKENSGNKPSYFVDNGNCISYYGKIAGANGTESIAILLALSKIVKQITFYQIKDNNTNKLADKYIKLLQDNNIIINDTNIILPDNSNISIENETEEELRNQPKFIHNLLEKYGDKKCCICGCDIEKTIIASHIHRVCDIKNSNLSREDKIKQIVDANNGLWLCAEHDKLFEYGFIYFKKNIMNINSKILNQMQIDFIKNISFGNFELKDYNPAMEQYLELHRKRIERL